MSKPDPQKIARLYLEQQVESKGRTKTAGEVRFIKDRSGDKGEWAFGPPGATERDIEDAFEFKRGQLKPLAQTLRSTLMALGHAQSAAATFTKIKSARISPDGNLGGKGYIQKITDMRRQYMNCVEALSALSDTLYDEINAPHWQPGPDLGTREREDVEEIMQDAEEIREDPEGWAEEEEAEMDEENAGQEKRASRRKTAGVTPVGRDEGVYWFATDGQWYAVWIWADQYEGTYEGPFASEQEVIAFLKRNRISPRDIRQNKRQDRVPTKRQLTASNLVRNVADQYIDRRLR